MIERPIMIACTVLLLLGTLLVRDVFASEFQKKLPFKADYIFVHLGKPMVGIPYQFVMTDGSIIEGRSDQKGKTVSVYTNKSEEITFNVLKDEGGYVEKNSDPKRFFLIINEQTGDPIPYVPYQIIMPNGNVIEGVTDGDGETATVYMDKPELLVIKTSVFISARKEDTNKNDRGKGCHLNAPGPLLKKIKYKDYKLSPKSNKSYTEEKITLLDGIKLTVETGACIESSRTTFSFRVPKKILENKSPKEKLIWLRSQLNSLSWNKNYRELSDEMENILNIIDTEKPFSNGKFHKLQICHNGKIPGLESDCSWESGGATEYEWRENDIYVYLIFTDYYSA